MELKNRSFQVRWCKNTQVDTFSGFPNPPVQSCFVTITGFKDLGKNSSRKLKISANLVEFLAENNCFLSNMFELLDKWGKLAKTWIKNAILKVQKLYLEATFAENFKKSEVNVKDLPPTLHAIPQKASGIRHS